jgi:hypothetical protein
MVGVLVISIRESQTIVVAATPAVPGQAAAPISASVVSELVAPRYTGRNAQGGWELIAAQASQLAAGATQGQGVEGLGGEVSLSQVAARWEPDTAPALALQAPTARYTPSLTELALPQGVAATGVAGGYNIQLYAKQGAANLSATTLNLTGGVSATLTPR